MQINLTGFLNGKNSRIFMAELWSLLWSAQTSETGIPQELVDLKVEGGREGKVRSWRPGRLMGGVERW